MKSPLRLSLAALCPSAIIYKTSTQTAIRQLATFHSIFSVPLPTGTVSHNERRRSIVDLIPIMDFCVWEKMSFSGNTFKSTPTSFHSPTLLLIPKESGTEWSGLRLLETELFYVDCVFKNSWSMETWHPWKHNICRLESEESCSDYKYAEKELMWGMCRVSSLTVMVLANK